MIKVTFPDGGVREYAKGTTAMEIAASISPRLAQEALSATVNGEIVDLKRPLEEDATIRFHKWEDPEGKKAFWHSSSHLMAEALEALYPGIKFGIGPSIENGFYYDVDSPVPITEGDREEDGGAGSDERGDLSPRGEQGRGLENLHRKGRSI